jgi:hypothetical protein
MRTNQARRCVGWAAALVAFAALALGGCKEEKKSTRWDQAASAAPTAPATAAPTEKPKEGGAFNKFFPADGTDGAKRVFSQEKDGFAEAKLTKDGKELAVLSISDIKATPDAKDKFAKATEKLDAYPLVTVGKNQSAILVKDHWQVKVSSTTLDGDARKTWLSKFDLKGLSAL